jgi:hypothetical protein
MTSAHRPGGRRGPRCGCRAWPSLSAPPRGHCAWPLPSCARRRGTRGDRLALPLITDGLALVAYRATNRLSRSAARYAWAVVITAAGLSGLARAVYLASGATLTASPTLRFGIGAWPAMAAAIAAHLLHLLTAHDESSR